VGFAIDDVAWLFQRRLNKAVSHKLLPAAVPGGSRLRIPETRNN